MATIQSFTAKVKTVQKFGSEGENKFSFDESDINVCVNHMQLSSLFIINCN